ncbi:hypothetical protein B0H19DRAFT_969717, partial [Mycena capillaripes]
FTSDNPSIKNVTNTYLAMGGALHLLETAVGDKGLADNNVTEWVKMQTATICTGEVSALTDRASRGQHFEDAKSLRPQANSVTLEHLQTFCVPGLLQLYERATRNLQEFLQAVIGKDLSLHTNKTVGRAQRNPDMVSIYFI